MSSTPNTPVGVISMNDSKAIELCEKAGIKVDSVDMVYKRMNSVQYEGFNNGNQQYCVKMVNMPSREEVLVTYWEYNYEAKVSVIVKW